MERVEYKVLKHQGADWHDGVEKIGVEVDAELLNRYGSEGWEVCGTLSGNEGYGTESILLTRHKAAWTGH